MTNGIGRTVLVVEDDPSVRKLVAGFLGTRGYRVIPAAGGEEAIAAAAGFAGEIHLVVTDFRLGGMNGLELAARLAPGRPGMATLLISGYTEVPLQPGPGTAPQVEFLSKPFTMDEFLGKVAEMVKPLPEGTGPWPASG